MQSRLAECLRAKVQADGGIFIAGKFDVLERPESSYPLVRAFTDLIRQLGHRLERDDPNMTSQFHPVLKALQEIANTDFLLVDKIPLLRQFQTMNYQTRMEDNHVAIPLFKSKQKSTKKTYLADFGGGPDGQRRVQFAFCRLVQAICSSSMPLVLFLDDLQWAKSEPLGIMTALLTNNENTQGFMLVGACRDDEVPMDHPLSVMLRNLEEEHHNMVTIADIQLSNLDKLVVESMVNDTFGQLKNEIIARISNLVWEQGHGNTFFTIQLIRGLLDCRINEPPIRTKRINEILEMFQFQSSLDLLNHVIRSLPQFVQDTLKMASCFGVEFYPCLLEDLTVCDVEEALTLSQYRGLICRAENVENNVTMRFTHDQILESAYALIPEGERQEMHLSIARRLLDSLSEDELNSHEFVLMRQIRLGAALIRDQNERYRIAELLLHAGQRAMKTASFEEAATHFNLGIGLLGDRHWRDEYFLSLELYNGAAAVSHCNGDDDQTKYFAQTVLRNARMIEHKMDAYILQMETSFAIRGKVLEIGTKALSQSSFPLPRRVGLLRILLELETTKRILKRYSNEDIKQLPRIEENSEEAKIATLLMAMHPAVLPEDPKMGAIIPMRAVQIILRHGLCNVAPAVFATFAWMLADFFGQFQLGERLALLSVDLVKQLKAYEWLTRVTVVTHAFVFSINEPLRCLIDPIEHAYLSGLTGRDLTVTLVSASLHTYMSLIASIPLQTFVPTMESNLKLMIGRQGGHPIGLSFFLIPYQLVLNFVNQSENPLDLTGELMDEESLAATSEANPALCASILFSKLMLCCHFQRFENAESLIDQCESGTAGLAAPLIVSLTLYSGVAFAALSKTRTRLRLRRLRQKLRSLKSLVKNSANRYDGHTFFLEAEIAGIQGRLAEAIALFERSIDLLSREGFTNIVGLASERAATILLDQNRAEESDKFLLMATKAYLEWGAKAKVENLLPRLTEKSRIQCEENNNQADSPGNTSYT